MKRRDFLLKTGIIGGAALASGTHIFANNEIKNKSNSAQFKLKYAPGLNAFPTLAGKDPIEVIKFCHDQGFKAVFDNGLIKRTPELQEKIANELARKGMDFGPFVLYADFKTESMVLNREEDRDMLKAKLQEGIEVQKRTGAKTALMVPGRYNEKLERDYQTSNVIECMKELSAIAEKSGLVIVLEPLNQWNHPGLFLTDIPQSYMICEAVDSPSCKIVNDFYHQQISEGNLITNMNRAWDQIGAFHIGDNPGRKEPTTGEINYLNIFKAIHKKGYDGVLCCEHGRSLKGKEGELAMIEAYRQCDNF
jgi:hydroxypyruvate isomerase